MRLSIGSLFPLGAETVEKAHGRLEIRSIKTSTALNDYLNFPHVAQVFRIERHVEKLKAGTQSTEIVFGVTCLTPEQAGPPRLLGLNRGHWGIENRSHWVRDVTFDEDRSTIRTGVGPRVMASLRNFVIALMRLLGVTNIAKKLRELAAKPHRALAMLGI